MRFQPVPVGEPELAMAQPPSVPVEPVPVPPAPAAREMMDEAAAYQGRSALSGHFPNPKDHESESRE